MARGNPGRTARADRLRGNRHTLAFAAAGLAAGAAIKVLDVSTSNAANVFSQLTVWVLVCTAIAVLSESPPARIAQRVPLLRGDALYVLSRGGGAGHPLFARVRDGVAGALAAQPAFRAPRLGRKGPGALSRLVGAGVVAAALAATVILFDRIRAWGIIACAATAALLFGDPRRARR